MNIVDMQENYSTITMYTEFSGTFGLKDIGEYEKQTGKYGG